MALPQGYLATSNQVSIGEATAVTLATSASSWYAILKADRDIEVKQAGFYIGYPTVQDAAAPASSYTKVELWNITQATKIAESSVLGQGYATQILPGGYVTIATEAGIDDLGNSEASANDVIGLKFSFTNKGATAGFPDAVAHIRYSVID